MYSIYKDWERCLDCICPESKRLNFSSVIQFVKYSGVYKYVLLGKHIGYFAFLYIQFNTQNQLTLRFYEQPGHHKRGI